MGEVSRMARFGGYLGIIAAVAGFVPVCKVADIPQGTGRVIDADGVEVAVFNVDGVFHALENSCASGGSIGEGQLRGHIVTCPLDGETYDVRNGISPISDAIFVKHFDARVDGAGNVLVRLEPTEDEDEEL
ncbi:MAG: nitrite reductase (NAD(P)H) small subunit [Candidatus Dormiibacterota bacterium]